MKRIVLDFQAQAEQALQLIESRVKTGSKESAKQFLVLKFKTLYEQGVIAGKDYVREGISPFESATSDDLLY
jgi:hypothetical protein